VIAFGAAMEDDEAYRRYAMPGIERAKEADSEVYAFAAAGPIPRSYNLVLDMAAGRDDLEALVLVHQDIELADPDLCAKVRAALAEPDVAVVGSAGATGVSGIAWWEGSVSAAPALHRYNEHGSGELPAFSWLQAAPAPAEVDTLDGSLLVLSPWAVRNVRFDEALRLGYGFDLDFCRQVRAAGRRVMTADLRTIRHRPLEVVRE
jgi:GT2 family glycosyltransferase